MTGHRDLTRGGAATVDRAALERKVHEVLEMVADIWRELCRLDGATRPSGDMPQMRIVSALALGADQIVAEAGLERGWQVDAVLPFPAEEYRRDFVDPSARSRFDRLLAAARTVTVVDGSRADAPAAYEAAGLEMLARCDLLLALWDGRPAAGRGGTAEIVAHAIADKKPIVVVDPAAPARPRLIDGSVPESGGDAPAAPVGTNASARLVANPEAPRAKDDVDALPALPRLLAHLAGGR